MTPAEILSIKLNCPPCDLHVHLCGSSRTDRIRPGPWATIKCLRPEFHPGPHVSHWSSDTERFVYAWNDEDTAPTRINVTWDSKRETFR